MVPTERIELSHPCGYTLLKRARLPIPPRRLRTCEIVPNECERLSSARLLDGSDGMSSNISMGSETTTAFEKQYAEILREAGPVSDDMLFQLTGLALLRQEPTSCSRNLAVLLGFYRESLQRGVASSKFLGPSLAVAKNISE